MLVTKTQPCGCSAHSATVNIFRDGVLAGSKLQAVGHHAEGGEHTTALRPGVFVDHGRQRRAFQSSFQFVLVAEPGEQFLGRRLQIQQVGEDFSRYPARKTGSPGRSPGTRQWPRSMLPQGVSPRRRLANRAFAHPADSGLCRRARESKTGRYIPAPGRRRWRFLPVRRFESRVCRMRVDLPLPESPMMRKWLSSIERGMHTRASIPAPQSLGQRFGGSSVTKPIPSD